MQIEKLLARVKSFRNQFAVESLSNTPKDTSSFGYGRAVGFVQGLDRAEQLILEMVEDEKRDEVE